MLSIKIMTIKLTSFKTNYAGLYNAIFFVLLTRIEVFGFGQINSYDFLTTAYANLNRFHRCLDLINQ